MLNWGSVELRGFSVELTDLWNLGVFGVEMRGFWLGTEGRVELRGFRCGTEKFLGLKRSGLFVLK